MSKISARTVWYYDVNGTDTALSRRDGAQEICGADGRPVYYERDGYWFTREGSAAFYVDGRHVCRASGELAWYRLRWAPAADDNHRAPLLAA